MTASYSIRCGSIVGLILEENSKFRKPQYDEKKVFINIADNFGIDHVNRATNEKKSSRYF